MSGGANIVPNRVQRQSVSQSSGSGIVCTLYVKWRKHFTQRQNIPHNIRTLERYRYTALMCRRCCHVVGIKMPYRIRKWENRKTIIIVSRNFPLPFMHRLRFFFHPRPNRFDVCARVGVCLCSIAKWWIDERIEGGKNRKWLDLHTKTL